MALDLVNYQDTVAAAVRLFWQTRMGSGGNRADVVQGRHLDGFVGLITDLPTANGLDASCVRSKGDVVLPGYFRATKSWDVIVVHEKSLIAAFEFKSQVGPSFGNNFNNRLEEALGSATDLWTAFREEAFGVTPRPFLGYLVLLEDCEASRRPVKVDEPHFPIFPGFRGASYLERYKLLCEKLVAERVYDSATLLFSERTAGRNGNFNEYYLHDFVTSFAGHVAAAAS